MIESLLTFEKELNATCEVSGQNLKTALDIYFTTYSRMLIVMGYERKEDAKEIGASFARDYAGGYLG